MRCSSCGKDVPNDEIVFDTTNVQSGSPGAHGKAYTQTAPIWLCSDCIAYRPGTFRILYWIVGIVFAIAAISFIYTALFQSRTLPLVARNLPRRGCQPCGIFASTFPIAPISPRMAMAHCPAITSITTGTCAISLCYNRRLC
jgi:hypothetical protein